jgi:hypothetical protein
MVRDSGYYVKLFRKAREFDTQRFEDYKTNVAFYEGTYKLLASYADDKPWVIDINSPYMSDAVDIRIASLQSSDYVGELEPLSPQDEKDIFLLNEITRTFWNEMNMDNHINNAIEKVAIVRDAFTHIVFDDSRIYGGTKTLRKGALEAYLIDPSSILIDPNALSLRDADYIVVVERITRQQAKDEGYISSLDAPIGNSMTTEERGELYEGNEYNAEQEGILTKRTFYEKRDNKVFKTILVENDIVEEEKEFPLDIFPIAQLRWQKKFKSAYSLSLIDRLIDLQKSINAVKSATTNTALQFACPSFVVSEASGINPKTLAGVIGVPGLVIKSRVNVNDSVKTLFDNVIDPNLVALASKDEEAIYRLAGATPEFQGNYGSSGNTKGGSESTLSRAKIIEQKFLNNLEEYVEDLTKIIVRFIVLVFAGHTIYARGAKKSNGKYDFKKYDVPSKLQDLDYTYSIHLDIKTPYAKEKTKALLQELFAMEQQYQSPVKVLTILDILKEYDIPNRRELVERYENLTSKDAEAKSEIITQWSFLTMKHNIDPNIISQGIKEIIDGKELKIVEEVSKQIEAKIAQAQAQAQAQQEAQISQQAQFAQKAMQQQSEQQSQIQQAQAQQGVTGDEEFGENAQQQMGQQAPQVTGDEEF